MQSKIHEYKNSNKKVMSKSYININWNGLHKLAKEKSPGDASSAFYTSIKEARKKFEAFEKKYRDLEWKKKLAYFKSLPVGTPIYFTGTDRRLAGKCGKKVGDGTKRMKVRFDDMDMMQWNCVWVLPYKQIQTEPLSQQQLNTLKISHKIQDVLNR